MTWFTENPTPPVALGTLIAAIFAVVLVKTGKREALWGILATAAVTIAVVAANLLIVTPREEVTQALDEIRQLIEDNKREELLKRIDPANGHLRNQVNSELAYVTVTSAKINDLDVTVAESKTAARAKFIGVLDFRDGAGRFPHTHFVLNFLVELKKLDGVWVVSSARWEVFNPAGQSGLPTSAPVAKSMGDGAA
jgi:hypothetical protein